MKAFTATLFLVLCAGAAAGRTEDRMSPVTRTVELMKGLAEKIEQDGKAEEDLYETFVCWAKSIISQKTASNAAAQSRIDMLKAYIADLDSGRIELTTERVDLEAEIEKLRGEIEVAEETRAKENEDFLDAEDEMKKAVKALEDAIDVLKIATEEHKQGVLLSLKGQLSEGASERAAQAASLHRAADLGDKVLTKGDATFLRRLLTGEVPTADWKKLNRKATFKKSYKARSFKIQDVLAKLLETTEKNLAEATAAEKEAKALFDKLMLSKNDELSTAQQALKDMAGENGAKAMSRADSQKEVDELEAQVSADEGYITQVKGELADMKLQWKERKALRSEELAAISKAISILHNDDSRDLFKKSFASHDESGMMFLQTATSQRASKAVEALRTAAKKSADTRLSMLAMRLKTGNHFDDVITAIDEMITTLKSEEASDLEKKETCESDRAADTRTAAKAARTVDEHSDAISTLETEISELQKEVAEKDEAIATAKEELKEAKDNRDKEHAEFLVDKKDDQDAAALVKSAQGVLESFYADNNLMLVQESKKGHAVKAKQPFESTAGEAPPPPPTTWEAPYGGATGESTGIIAILDMIHSDILKDIEKADKEEADSLDMYTKTKTALDNDVIDLTNQIIDHNSTISTKEQDVTDNKGDKALKKGELEAVMKKMADANDFCVYFTVNYPLRLKNRQVEMDGLDKAKAILEGGSFATPDDPNREMKPGDALIQANRNLRLRRA